ncbi:siphovirus ReqiPepy6 Gp37-like family protein, partial [Acaricomes phytoseiuli]|uniref:siphovirus ReqiPepy6 Gp37-like family protein n=2 Tax=Acaricomes phytoseiuli TaxID=291968 RepID=UPI00222364A1
MFNLWLITPELQPAGKLQASKVTCVLRYADTGTWTAQINGEAATSSQIRPGCRVALRDDSGEVFSGPITTIDRSRLQIGVVNLNLSGKTDDIALEDRIVYPDPFRPVEAQREDYYTDSGSAGEVIANLIMRNAGASALPERVTPGLMVDRLADGPRAQVRARFSPLREEIASLERQHGLRVSTTYRLSDRRLHSTITTTTDRSRSMVLSQRTGTLGESSVSTTAPSATAVVLAGDGEGRNRRMMARSLDRADWWGDRRVEEFKDRRDTSSDKELAEAWDKLVPDIIGSAAVTTNVRERPGQVFGRDYQLGDKVSISWEGTRFTDVVQAGQITWDSNGRSVSVTIGQRDAQDSPTPPW